MMPRIQVDKGAIRFVMGGANVMCPGITSAGGAIPVELPEGAPVAVYAQDKEHAMAVGLLRMSTADMCVSPCCLCSGDGSCLSGDRSWGEGARAAWARTLRAMSGGADRTPRTLHPPCARLQPVQEQRHRD